MVKLVLQTLMGIKRGEGNNHIQRKEGVVGKLAVYISTVEAQERGTLHLHMILWLENMPILAQIKEALHTDAFRKQVAAYIRATIHANLDGATASKVMKIKPIKGIVYSQPVNPKDETILQLQLRRRDTWQEQYRFINAVLRIA